jgi:L-fuconate dehydratase
LRERGYPAYTTGPGWLGYSEEKMRRLATEAVAKGFSAIKQKVGGNIAEDQRRASICVMPLAQIDS